MRAKNTKSGQTGTIIAEVKTAKRGVTAWMVELDDEAGCPKMALRIRIWAKTAVEGTR